MPTNGTYIQDSAQLSQEGQCVPCLWSPDRIHPRKVPREGVTFSNIPRNVSMMRGEREGLPSPQVLFIVSQDWRRIKRGNKVIDHAKKPTALRERLSPLWSFFPAQSSSKYCGQWGWGEAQFLLEDFVGIWDIFFPIDSAMPSGLLGSSAVFWEKNITTAALTSFFLFPFYCLLIYLSFYLSIYLYLCFIQGPTSLSLALNLHKPWMYTTQS